MSDLDDKVLSNCGLSELAEADWREEQRRSFAFGNCNIENPKVTREIVDEEAERMADSKNAPVTEDIRRSFSEIRRLWWERNSPEPIIEYLANLQRRWQAEARLEQHRKDCFLCRWPDQARMRGTPCETLPALERELAEASHE